MSIYKKRTQNDRILCNESWVQRTWTKLNNYLQGFHTIPISEKNSKYDVSDSKDDTYRGVLLHLIWVLYTKTFLKELHDGFFWNLMNFFSIGITNKSYWIAQKILKRKVKEVLQRSEGTAVAMELQKKPKWITEWHFTLIVFRGIGVSSCGCFVLEKWLDIR